MVGELVPIFKIEYETMTNRRKEAIVAAKWGNHRAVSLLESEILEDERFRKIDSDFVKESVKIHSVASLSYQADKEGVIYLS